MLSSCYSTALLLHVCRIKLSRVIVCWSIASTTQKSQGGKHLASRLPFLPSLLRSWHSYSHSLLISFPLEEFPCSSLKAWVQSVPSKACPGAPILSQNTVPSVRTLSGQSFDLSTYNAPFPPTFHAPVGEVAALWAISSCRKLLPLFLTSKTSHRH